MLPAGSVCLVTTLPEVCGVAEVTENVPLGATVVVPVEPSGKVTVIVAPGSPVPMVVNVPSGFGTELATGASGGVTSVTVKVNVLAEGSMSTPPFAVPSLSRTWKVKLGVPAPALGVKTRLVNEPTGITSPAFTATPESFRVPDVGRDVMTTLASVLAGASFGSVKGKSAAENVLVWLSSMEAERSAPDGTSLTEVIVRASVDVSVPPLPSEIV